MVWRAIYQPILVMGLLWAFDPVWALALALIVFLSNLPGAASVSPLAGD